MPECEGPGPRLIGTRSRYRNGHSEVFLKDFQLLNAVYAAVDAERRELIPDRRRKRATSAGGRSCDGFRDPSGSSRASGDKPVQRAKGVHRRQTDKIKTAHAALEPVTQLWNVPVGLNVRPKVRVDHRQSIDVDSIASRQKNVIGTDHRRA